MIPQSPRNGWASAMLANSRASYRCGDPIRVELPAFAAFIQLSCEPSQAISSLRISLDRPKSRLSRRLQLFAHDPRLRYLATVAMCIELSLQDSKCYPGLRSDP